MNRERERGVTSRRRYCVLVFCFMKKQILQILQEEIEEQQEERGGITVPRVVFTGSVPSYSTVHGGRRCRRRRFPSFAALVTTQTASSTHSPCRVPAPADARGSRHHPPHPAMLASPRSDQRRAPLRWMPEAVGTARSWIASSWDRA
jgi:hypothetical protein